jgi:hypothetical protein
MTSTISNQARRSVSFRGNSGQTWHLPPGVSIDVADVEIADNLKIQKLTRQGVITVQEAQPSDAAPGPSEKPHKPKSRAAER